MDLSDIEFIPGLTLSERFYHEVVSPILHKHLADLHYTAALIGFGSDVIGMDTPMSRDHMWGPRMQIFLPPKDFDQNKARLDAILRHHLPNRFLGYPTSFGPPDEAGVRLLVHRNSGPVDHLIEIDTLEAYFNRELGPDSWQAPEIADWLTFSEHRLLTLTTGRVFHDELGLTDIREKLGYYPEDVWRYLMASDWSQIGQEEHFMGRTADNGDEIGSQLITARLVQSAMRLVFRFERQYIPYSKWFGSVFRHLPSAADLLPHIQGALSAASWQTREQHLCHLYCGLVKLHNQLGITAPQDPECSGFHGRPFQVVHAERTAVALQQSIQDPQLRSLDLYGSVNQFSSAPDLLENPVVLARMKSIYPPFQ